MKLLEVLILYTDAEITLIQRALEYYCCLFNTIHVEFTSSLMGTDRT